MKRSLKKTLPALLALCLALLLAPAALAADTTADTGPLIRDQAGLLADWEAQELESAARDYADRFGVAIYVLTVDSLDGMERRAFAENYYKENDLGCGADRCGVVFMVSMGEREYITIDYGWAQDPDNCPFSDYAIDETESHILPDLSDGDYYSCFSRYVADYGGYLEYQEQEGHPYDPPRYTEPVELTPQEEFIATLSAIGISLLISSPVAFLVCGIMKRRMRSTAVASSAGDYVSRKGVTLRVRQDTYTHSTETRVKIETNSSRSGGGGGGSSFNSGGFGGSSGGKF